MPVAFNTENGSAVFLDPIDGGWKPAPLAKNEAGESVAFDGSAWVPIKAPEPTSGINIDLARAARVASRLTPLTLPSAIGDATAQQLIESFKQAKPLNMAPFLMGPSGEADDPARQAAVAAAQPLAAIAMPGTIGRMPAKIPVMPEVPPAAPTRITVRPQAVEYPALPPPVESAALGASRSAGAAGVPGGPLADVSQSTLQKMKEVISEEGLTPHTLEQRISEMSPHEFLGELSPNTKLHMSALQSGPGGARNEIVGVVQQRAREAEGRMTSAFDSAFGPGENRAELARTIQIDRDQSVKPFWDTFRATPVPPTPTLRALQPRLQQAGAWSAAQRALGIEGVAAEREFLSAPGPGKATSQFVPLSPGITTGAPAAGTVRAPSAAFYQAAKEALDDAIEKAMANPGGANQARRLTQLKNDLTRAIDQHPDQNVAGLWKTAREQYATPTQLITAMKMGERALTNHIHADELPFITASFSPAEMRAFNIGIRGRLEDIAGRPGRVESGLINTVLARSNQQKIKWAVGDQKANELISAIEHEQRMHNAPSQIIYNSMTAPRLEAQKVWQPAPSRIQEFSDIAASPHRIPGAVLKKGIEMVSGHHEAKAAAEYSKLREEAARIFTLQGPERDAVLKFLVDSTMRTRP